MIEDSTEKYRYTRGLIHSYNTATVRLGMDLGLETVFATMEQLGFKPSASLVPAMLLGSFEMTPIQVAQVYHTLASGGFYTPARVINAVYTPDGETLQRYPLQIEQHLDPGAVFLVDKTLQAVVREGTGRSLSRWLSPDLGIAGKTGTTNDLRDTWFAGFSGNRLAVVWVGRDDNKSTGLTGATGAMQVFGRTMSQIPNTPLVLTPPDNIEWAVVNPQTGLATRNNAPGALAVPFIRGSAPAVAEPVPDPVTPPPAASPGAGTQPKQKKSRDISLTGSRMSSNEKNCFLPHWWRPLWCYPPVRQKDLCPGPSPICPLHRFLKSAGLFRIKPLFPMILPLTTKGRDPIHCCLRCALFSVPGLQR